MTKEQHDNVERYIQILQDSIADKKETEQLRKEVKRVVYLLEEQNRSNIDDHEQFREQNKLIKDLINEMTWDNENSKERALRQNQKINELIEEEICKVNQKIKQVENRSIFVMIWQSMKNEYKYIGFYIAISAFAYAIYKSIINHFETIIEIFK